MYADDTVLYISHTKVEISITLIHSYRNALYTWCNRNKLTINCKKLVLFVWYEAVYKKE